MRSKNKQTRVYKTFYGAFCTLILFAIIAAFAWYRLLWVIHETPTLYYVTQTELKSQD